MSIKPHKAMHRIKLPQFVTLIIFWSLKFSKFLSASLGSDFWNLDLRLMLCMKKIVTAFADDEMQRIRDVISSAILDSNVKGGLRWPLGKAFSGGRYNVVEIWHTFTTTYENPSLKLKLRHANRFDFTTLAGETGWEVRLFLKMLVSKLQEENVEVGLISDMLQENVKLIWDNFLCCEPFLT